MRKDLAGSDRGLMEGHPDICVRRIRKNTEPLNQGGRYFAKIRTKHLPNESLERYCKLNPLGARFLLCHFRSLPATEHKESPVESIPDLA
jgi:hypothetical protein